MRFLPANTMQITNEPLYVHSVDIAHIHEAKKGRAECFFAMSLSLQSKILTDRCGFSGHSSNCIMASEMRFSYALLDKTHELATPLKICFGKC
jgi:hypothetical protein